MDSSWSTGAVNTGGVSAPSRRYFGNPRSFASYGAFPHSSGSDSGGPRSERLEFTGRPEQYITCTVLPDLKRLGPRLGRGLPSLREMIARTDPAELLRTLETKGRVRFVLADGPVELDSDDLQVRLQAREGWTAAGSHPVDRLIGDALVQMRYPLLSTDSH